MASSALLQKTSFSSKPIVTQVVDLGEGAVRLSLILSCAISDSLGIKLLPVARIQHVALVLPKDGDLLRRRQQIDR